MPDLTPEEIERLPDLLRKLADSCSDFAATACRESADRLEFLSSKGARPLAERVRELEAENARLRSSLSSIERIASAKASRTIDDIRRDFDAMMYCARAALAQKEERSA